MTPHEKLWRRLRDVLGRTAVVETPAELAAAFGNADVIRFVWDYYYPHAWNAGGGAISHEVATEIVNRLAGAPPPPRDARSATSACAICGEDIDIHSRP